jgi:hypothetical protein
MMSGTPKLFTLSQYALIAGLIDNSMPSSRGAGSAGRCSAGIPAADRQQHAD